MKIHIYVRERSERVPGKVLREIGGVQLWKHTMLKFRGHDVYLDTDSRRILADCEADPDLSHVTAYARHHHHAMNPEPGMAMTERFFRDFVTDPIEPVAIVHVTSPFLRIETVERMVSEVRGGTYDSAATVTRIRDYAYREQGGAWIPLNHDGRNIPGTQSLEPVFHLNHAAFVVTKDSLARWGHRIGARPYMHVTEFPENLDLDWEEDFALADAVVAREVMAS